MSQTIYRILLFRLKGGKNSDIKPQRTSNLAPKRRIYMDEAISKTSKHHKTF